eukprot:Blabericola_migrator_1__116@NODE_102_length_14292_cov_312_776380_g90_i0_p1_GENE_NODE_102_length_14292_cov_312_776380_g90_i0NODE_102_length_14292_cov_312_776380_g90_i0_p1_ORF_typecomplete_len1283_score247_16MutS_V/PF00488_21/4_4e64MutS_III/PF05192_18/5_2e45MutS_I/PF01624_20/1_7e26MutS_I/PF01624_20/2_1e03MutS_II/PF05188_17/0_001MutS_II/PF05188_17/5e03MutS_IV/PF05190_18/0_088ATPase_2/PF01637_18/0_52AAA_16/PF13191_6/2_6e03AAA_16/PF13191_6/0_93_NODE_102_length_14292_cov_312_776380_g90_i0143862
MSTPNQPSLLKFFQNQPKLAARGDKENHKPSCGPESQTIDAKQIATLSHTSGNTDEDSKKDANPDITPHQNSRKRPVSPSSSNTTPAVLGPKRRRTVSSTSASVDDSLPVVKRLRRPQMATLFDSDEEDASALTATKSSVPPLTPVQHTFAAEGASEEVHNTTTTSAMRGRAVPKKAGPKRRSTVGSLASKGPTAKSAASVTKTVGPSTESVEDIDPDTLWQLDAEDELVQSGGMEEEDTTTAHLFEHQYDPTLKDTLPLEMEKPSQSEAMQLLEADLAADSTQDEVISMNYYLYQCPVSQGALADYWRAFIEAYYSYHKVYSFPSWIDPAKMRDQNGNPVDSPDFDLTRIKAALSQKEAPNESRIHFTPALTQYWEVKRDYFDKIVFFKLGKFYEIFYTDACIMQRLCDLKWMGHDEKAHVGFPESSLHMYGQKAISAGLSVTVVEQMETPHELKERQQEELVKPKAVRREICEVYSQGTIAHHDMIGPEPTWLMCLFFHAQLQTEEAQQAHDCKGLDQTGSLISASKLKNHEGAFSCILVDVGSCKIAYMSHADESPNRPVLRTLMSHVNPKEVLLVKTGLPPDVLTLITSCPQKPSISYAPAAAHISAALATEALRRHFGDRVNEADESQVPAFLHVCNKIPTLRMAMLGACEYLQALFLKEKVLSFSTVEPWLAADEDAKQHLCLDAAAMRALEILVSNSGKVEDTLFHHINQCQTAFGARLLRKWLVAPLLSVDKINGRLDAVEWLLDNGDLLRDLREHLDKLPDLERLASRVSSQAVQVQRGAVYFSDTAQKKLGQFMDLLNSFLEAQQVTAIFTSYLADLELRFDNLQDNRLAALLTLQEAGGLFPDLTDRVAALKALCTTTKEGQIHPVPCSFPEFDEKLAEIAAADEEIRDYGKSGIWTEELEMDVPRDLSVTRFVDAKFKYELEVPDHIWKQVVKKKRDCGAEVWMTSTLKSCVRFQTTQLKAMAYQQAVRESKLQSLMHPFMRKLYGDFHDKSDFFLAAISLLAELDVLCSFAQTAANWAFGPYTRPVIIPADPVNAVSSIKVKNGYHPVVCKRTNYIPNDFSLGSDEEPCRSVVITGPNMGGKSTLARQVALLAIIAQMGSYVPAARLELVPLDRIFTRVGAYDSILENKSTFFVELEEVDSFLKHATPRSLGIIDEFGRGTSIEEGAALALSTIKYIAKNINCLCLFSTHFQDQFEKHLLNKTATVAFYYMASVADEESKKMIFLYKFLKGLCPKSHGLKIARLAGIPERIMRSADTFLLHKKPEALCN